MALLLLMAGVQCMMLSLPVVWGLLCNQGTFGLRLVGGERHLLICFINVKA
jgi:hypothetical protein